MNKDSSRGITIVVLDTGISNKFTNIIFDGYEMTKTNGEEFIVSNSIGIDLHGHGTAVANIIHSVESCLRIISFKICNYDNEVDSIAITKALTYIHDYLKVDIINISAGVTYIDDLSGMENICRKLYAKGVVVVSAFDNEGAVSYPAAFNEVIGVDCAPVGETNIVTVKNSIVDILIPTRYYRTFWNNGERALLCGTSFACAYFCGIYGKYLMEGGTNDVNSYMRNISSKVIECRQAKELSKPDFDVSKAIIFPVNKESHAILRNRTNLDFSVIGAYDDRLSGNVGKNFWGIVVQNFDSLDWNSDFDTVILSCISEFEKIVNKNYVETIINKCQEYSKQLYTFENVLNDCSSSKNKNITGQCHKEFYPSVDKSMVPYQKFNKLNRLSIPVVGVFGTSSKQGKYTLQLELIQCLKDQAYKVGFLATEPSGYLLSADYTFHFGYKANAQLSQRDIIAILNEYLFRIQLSGADIVITGCQSATVHYDNANINQFCIEQYGFLLGTEPDFSILCINAYDEIEYIKRTISCIQSVGDGKVSAIALFPKDVLSTATNIVYKTKIMDFDEITERKKYFYEKLSLPIYCIGVEEDIEKLCNQIIDFFSEEEQ